MELKVLVDNNTIIDSYYLGEPAVSYLIIDNGIKILFDVGYSNIFMQNALKMNETLEDLDYIVLSHGHNDHTGGLSYLLKNLKTTKPCVIAHKDTFLYREELGESIGSPVNLLEIEGRFKINLTNKPLWLTDDIVFLGEIEKTNIFENMEPIGKINKDGELVDDYILDDSAIVYKSNKGLVIITGCSHSGICNITEYAKKVCNDDRILDIIGGFHLLNPSKEQEDGTLNYFKKLEIDKIHPCHCTSLDFKIKLSAITNIKDVGVGLKLNLDAQ